MIDEVLAVGDEQFQAKCLDRIRTFQEEGRTILFVSHNADQIRAICDRAVVLDSGVMLTDASPNEAVRVFREHLGESDVARRPRRAEPRAARGEERRDPRCRRRAPARGCTPAIRCTCASG